MNERIKELLIQCQHESIDGPEYPRWTDLDKFTELIVKECADNIRKNVFTFHWEATATKECCIQEIKRTIGVEE